MCYSERNFSASCCLPFLAAAACDTSMCVLSRGKMPLTEVVVARWNRLIHTVVSSVLLWMHSLQEPLSHYSWKRCKQKPVPAENNSAYVLCGACSTALLVLAPDGELGCHSALRSQAKFAYRVVTQDAHWMHFFHFTGSSNGFSKQVEQDCILSHGISHERETNTHVVPLWARALKAYVGKGFLSSWEVSRVQISSLTQSQNLKKPQEWNMEK